MLRDSTTVAVAVAVAVAVVVRTRPRAIPLAMIHMRKSIHRFPFFPLYGHGAPLGGLRPPELRYDGEHNREIVDEVSDNMLSCLCCINKEFKKKQLRSRYDQFISSKYVAVSWLNGKIDKFCRGEVKGGGVGLRK